MIRPEELQDMEKAASEYAQGVFSRVSFHVPDQPDNVKTYEAIMRAIGQAWIEGFCIGRDGKNWRAKMVANTQREEV